MTTFEERRPISNEQHKLQQRERLNAVFGGFDHFNKLISNKYEQNQFVSCYSPPQNTKSPRRPPMPSPPQISKPAHSTPSSSAPPAPKAVPEPKPEDMTTEELLQSMQSILDPVKEPVAGPLKPRDTLSARGSSSTTHRSNGASSSASSRRERDREKEHKDSRRRDSERDRRPSTKPHHDRRHREEHRCSSVASTSAAPPPGRSSKEREETTELTAPQPSKQIDSLFVASSAAPGAKRSHRDSKSPQENHVGDEEVKRKRKKVSDDSKWKETTTSGDVQSPDSGIGGERGSSEEATDKPAAEKVTEDATEDDVEMPIDDILKCMTSLLTPAEMIPIPKLPYKSLADLQKAIRPPPPVLQPMKPLPQATNRATSPMSPPKRPLAAVSPMRPLRLQELQENHPTSEARSPYRGFGSKSKISLNLSVLPSDAVKRLKKEHARHMASRNQKDSPGVRNTPPTRVKRVSGERSSKERERKKDKEKEKEKEKIPIPAALLAWSPHLSPPRESPPKSKKKSPPKSARNAETPQCTSMPPSKPPSKPPSRNEDRSPSPANSEDKRRRRMQQIFGHGCCAPRTMPRKVVVPPVKNIPADPKEAIEYIQAIAKDLKHRGDAEENNKIKKTFLYIDAALMFTYATAHMDPNDHALVYNQIAQTVTFLKQIQKQCTRAVFTTDQEMHFTSRLQLVVRLCQSCLAHHLYDSMSDSHSKRFDMIQKLDSKRTPFHPEMASLAPSNAIQNETLTVNGQLYSLQVTQLKFCTHLYYSHKMWKDLKRSMSPIDICFKRSLDRLCDPMFPGCSLQEIAEYFYTALTWLRAEYREGCVYPHTSHSHSHSS
uniref:AF4/FMR2 family member lilli n=1 Tax=Steinernema glaseri TaxID=37863 RepID=A0A1I8AAM8_9BILA